MDVEYTLRSAKLKPLPHPGGGELTTVVLALCGSFNPIHKAHIALYETAKFVLRAKAPHFFVAGGFVSPVSDGYGKPNLRPIAARAEIAMAALSTHAELEVDLWEGMQPQYTRTLFVLQHLQAELRRFYASEAVRVVFVCGADVFASFATPGVWPLRLLGPLLESFPLCVVGRAELDSPESLAQLAASTTLTAEEEGAHYTVRLSAAEAYFGTFAVPDDTSSTGIRDALRRAKEDAADDEDVAALAADYIKDMVPASAVALTIAYYS